MRPPSVPTTIPINRDDSKQIVIMKSLYNALIEHREPKTQRILIQVFMCLPSRKEFPEYFNVISKPIAMNKIRERIERQQYVDEEACMEDFKLMFSNCKFFNEDDSQIHKDAVLLEIILRKRREQLKSEHNNRSSADSKNSVREAILNSTTTATTTITNHSSPTSTRGDRLNHNSTSNNNNNNNNNSSYQSSSNTLSAHSNNVSNKTASPHDHSIKQDGTVNSHNTNNKAAVSNSSLNQNNTSSNYTTGTNHNNSMPSTPNKTSNTNNNSDSNNGPVNNSKHISSQPSDSTNHSSSDQLNGNEDTNSSSINININHNHHHETSMDSSSNISADLLASTPVEKCSLNTRRGRNADAPKRQLLTGYIIYASEIRKQVIDKNPNQNFGDISRLVGNEWKALPHDIRSKYDQRALIHNKRVRERAQRELNSDGRLSNGLHTPKMTKRKLAKLAKEQMRQHHLSISSHNESIAQTPRLGQEHSSTMVSQTPSSTYKHPHLQHSQAQSVPQANIGKNVTVETSTQTNAIRFVEPPTKKRLVYSDTFRKYIEGLQVPNIDFLAEETTPERPPELPSHWLGAGLGRHESSEAALWALREFMLQDAATMRRSMEPYL